MSNEALEEVTMENDSIVLIEEPSDIYLLNNGEEIEITDSHPAYNGRWKRIPSRTLAINFGRKFIDSIMAIKLYETGVEVLEDGRIKVLGGGIYFIKPKHSEYDEVNAIFTKNAITKS